MSVHLLQLQLFEESDLLVWPIFVGFLNGTVVLTFNAFGLVTLLVLQQRQYAQTGLHAFLLGGMPGVISGVATRWLMHQSSPLPRYYNIYNNLVLILLLVQSPLVVMVTNWLIKRLARS